MPYLLNRNIFFIHIPKCGGTGITRQLHSKDKVKFVNDINLSNTTFIASRHAPVYIIINYFLPKEQFLNCYRFAFVRNPWDKLVSSYTWLFHAYSDNFEDYINKIKTLHITQQAYKYPCDITEIFKQPINKRNNRRRGNTHFIRQIEFLKLNNKIVVDTFPFEKFRESIDLINQKTNLQLQPIKNNKSNRTKGHYSNYYNDYTRQLVYELYKPDIEYFGYKFETE